MSQKPIVSVQVPPDVYQQLQQKAGGEPGQLSAILRGYIQTGLEVDRFMAQTRPETSPGGATGATTSGAGDN